MAFMAASRLPSVLFLKPMGMERPEAISRWVWLSVVRAPIAVQAITSAMYWGVMGSSSSVAAGNPEWAKSSSSLRANRNPC
jgi:hypothetical protein